MSPSKRHIALSNLLCKYKDWLDLSKTYPYIDKLGVVTELSKGFVSLVRSYKIDDTLFDSLEDVTAYILDNLEEDKIDNIVKWLNTNIDICLKLLSKKV